MPNSIDIARAILPVLKTIIADRKITQNLEHRLAVLLDVPNPETHLNEIEQLLHIVVALLPTKSERLEFFERAQLRPRLFVQQDSYTGSSRNLFLVGLITTPVDYELYTCDRCGHPWLRESPNQPIPTCPNHPDRTLIPYTPPES